jgi:hypothetical protein
LLTVATMRVLVLLSAAIWITGCDPAADKQPYTVHGYYLNSRLISCQTSQRCCTAEQLDQQAWDLDSCMTANGSEAKWQRVLDLVTDGSMAFDADAAARCVAAQRAGHADCTQVRLGPMPECEGVFRGRVLDGGACTVKACRLEDSDCWFDDQSMCVSGYCQVDKEQHARPGYDLLTGTCAPKPADACGKVTCASNEQCIGGACKRPHTVADGQPCGFDAECAPTSGCIKRDDSAVCGPRVANAWCGG